MSSKIIKLLVILSITLFSATVLANRHSLAEIIPQDRRIDWSHAGVPGGIPNRTAICATINAATYGNGTTDATNAIQTAINNCPNNQVVYVPAGTYVISNLQISHPVVLRGAGANQTKFISSGSIAFNPYGSTTSVPVHVHAVNWTAGDNKGDTVISLASTAGLSVGQPIVLDQLNDTSLVNVIGNEGHCGAGGAGNACGRNDDISASTCYGFCYGDQRAMPQIVGITAINGNQVTLDTPLYFIHNANLSPQAFYWDGGNMAYAGLENVRIDAQYNSAAVAFQFCTNCWAKGIEVDHIARGAINLSWTYHNEIRDSYFFQSQASAPENYGLELDNNSAALVENNIFNSTTAGVMIGWPNSGMVVAYNYTINDNPGSAVLGSQIESHDAHNYMNLIEGNVTPKIYLDFIWGSSSHETLFRNYLNGFKDPSLNNYWSNYDQPIIIEAWNRYINIVGNVLGKAGIHYMYEVSDGSEPVQTNYFDQNFNRTGWTDACSAGLNPSCMGMGVGPIYTLGYFNSYSPSLTGFDTRVKATLLRWGNFDYATNQTRWEVTEIPSGVLVPSDHTLPASLYLSSKPSWWNRSPWPAIGPDITGGNADTAGHAYKIPAQMCYENTIAKGLAFNASSCYASGGVDATPPAAPTGLRIR